MNRWAYLLIALLAAAPWAHARTDEVVVYPGVATDQTRTSYYVKLLELVLKKSGTPARMQPLGHSMVTLRVMQRMETGDDIDVLWSPSNQEMERRLLPIRIPIDKGLLGWRLLLIRKPDLARFASIQSRQQLQAYAAGQQRDWSDTIILRANSLPVVAAGLYQPMFQMLASDRFDYFPRGVLEIWNENQQHADLDLVVEPHLALHYPVHTYFFVSPRKPALVQRIERGLRAAIADGSFDRLFEQCNGEFIKRAQLGSRTVFELNNPLEPASQGKGNSGELRLNMAPASPNN